jgi:prepilin-type N-terminal cleavage/methylation domain-containing protein
MFTVLLSRLRARRPQGTAGFTLVEMLTVILLLTIILGIAFTELIQSQTTVRNNGNRLDQTQQVKSGIEAISRNLRTAIFPLLAKQSGTAAFVSASREKVQFYANINNEAEKNGVTLVTYEIVGTTTKSLVETLQPTIKDANGQPTNNQCPVGDSSCGSQSRTIIRGVDTSGGPVFTYNAYYLDPNTKQRVAYPIAETQLANAVTLKGIASVDISLSVRTGAGPAAVPASTVKNRVLMTNIPGEDPAKYPSCQPGQCPTPNSSQSPSNTPPTPRVGPAPAPVPPPDGFAA